MNYGNISTTNETSLIPPRRVNGGLYTGQPALLNAPWGNIPIIPEAHIYVEQLKHADPTPPPRATDTIPGGGTRIGNSVQTFPNHTPHSSMHHLQYVPDLGNGYNFL